uniref:Calcineurin-like phosphoesterase domain-containing protein n=1 Tax=Oryza nivara TaxID=4536 RepID=A0A0E0FXY5_ORYNI
MPKASSLSLPRRRRPCAAGRGGPLAGGADCARPYLPTAFPRLPCLYDTTLLAQSGSPLLGTLKMKSVRTILTHTYPYPHEHSRHIMTAVIIACLFFISSDNMHTLIHKLDNNIKWWSMYVAWICFASLYHLPSFQSMGVDMRMNLSLFLTIYFSSVLFIIAFHIVFIGLWYIGLVARMAGTRPGIWTIFQNCTVISIACCVFYSHCGNLAVHKSKSFSRNSDPNLLAFLENEKGTTWISNFLRMNELKDQICSSWFAPVGSASDYPLLSKWVIYGELVCSGSCAGPSDEISPLYSLWATFVGLYIANFVVERSTGWALTHPSTAAMKRTTDETQNDDLLYDYFNEREDLWFDFVADTGDGGNSSYTVARLLAQPSIQTVIGGSMHTLPRGNLLLIGGDLAYPNPSSFTYEMRFFSPYEYALQPPPWYRAEHIALDKPEVPLGISKMKDYDGPQCFIIPGNHDWFDGLHTFMRYVCHKSWLGGWFLPQKKSYFALRLPQGWWVFGLDLALHGDIDVYQFKFFAELCRNKIGENDSVIVMTHEPNWLLDWYWKETTGKNVSHLIQDYLNGRCKLRLAGDLHHFMRHSANQIDNPTSVQHLLVNGCGGAFLHPTHVFKNFEQFSGATYECKAAYPSFDDSSGIALGNILKFRKKNWQFDTIGGFIYFILVFSMFPQCNLGHILNEETWSGRLGSFSNTIWSALLYIFEHSYVSSVGSLTLLLASYSFVPSKLSRRKRAIIGGLHVLAHLTAALLLMLLLELGIEICIRNHLLATSGYHTLYDWYRSMESEHFPDPTGLRARLEQWTLGLYPACIKYLMSAFDVPEVMAVTRINICKNGMMSLSRSVLMMYYTSVFIYFWIFSTPVVSLIFGSYLYICINWFHIHFDEAFSSLRIANYKSFTRFHIKKDGNLEIFTLAVDKVPKDWKLDPKWEAEERRPHQLSHHRKHPSKWRSSSSPDPVTSVRVVDHFTISRTRTSDPNTSC